MIDRQSMEKIWLKNYPPHVPLEINPDVYSSLAELFEESCSRFKALPAYSNLGVKLSYQQVDRDSYAFAAYLQQVMQLKKGDRIALMLPNVLHYPVALFGALRAGLIVVNVNPLYTAPELIHQMNDSGAETLIVLTHFAKTVEEALPSTFLKNIIIADVGDYASFFKAWGIYLILKYIKKAIPKWHIPGAIRFKKVLAKGRTLSLRKVIIDPEDTAFLQYTGGTTGIAKGAMLTHRNLIANIQQATAWFNFEFGKEIFITALPMYHIFSLMANCLFCFHIGGLNILITNPRDIPGMVKEIKQFKFSVITGVNTLFNALLRHLPFSQVDFQALKVALGGGAAVQRAVAEKWQLVTGTPLREAYGLTETSPCVTINPTTLTTYNGTVGLPVSSTDVCILDNDGKEVPIGQAGELAVKGPQVMRGYWQKPAETRTVFTPSGWLLTGDIASIDEAGFVRILERKKDMIIVSGFNVYPNEIEDTLMRIPGVTEAAVVGVKDEHSGEAVKAFIVKNKADLSIQDVIEFCRHSLTAYKVPKYITFCQELPKTNVGKILRRQLRDNA